MIQNIKTTTFLVYAYTSGHRNSNFKHQFRNVRSDLKTKQNGYEQNNKEIRQTLPGEKNNEVVQIKDQIHVRTKIASSMKLNIKINF